MEFKTVQQDCICQGILTFLLHANMTVWSIITSLGLRGMTQPKLLYFAVTEFVKLTTDMNLITLHLLKHSDNCTVSRTQLAKHQFLSFSVCKYHTFNY
jgi:hypothetical protein